MDHSLRDTIRAAGQEQVLRFLDQLDFAAQAARDPTAIPRFRTAGPTLSQRTRDSRLGRPGTPLDTTARHPTRCAGCSILAPVGPPAGGTGLARREGRRHSRRRWPGHATGLPPSQRHVPYRTRVRPFAIPDFDRAGTRLRADLPHIRSTVHHDQSRDARGDRRVSGGSSLVRASRRGCHRLLPGNHAGSGRATGRLLLADKDSLALAPDGHGGLLAALDAPRVPGPRGNGALSCSLSARSITRWSSSANPR